MDDDLFASAKLGKLKPSKIDLATNNSMAKCRWPGFANLAHGSMNWMASSRFQFAASILRAMAFAKCLTDRKA
ncbi:hypothetical protein EUGRSUZ_L00877 [Eucalyptus grandis]|uniref:Uncharacterized protein n=1 Tax=Eucalyptus grandis TaxID=71139 RepID=A0A058ZVR6_EUCGR|nr:hypothetical protein EUGRSUZ_L00877 [Eucalyptus grandis]